MATMTRAQFRKELQEGLNTLFGLEYKRHPEEWRQIFDVNNSKKAYEEDVLLVGLGPAQVKPEGGSVAYDAGQEGWVARYVNETIALAFALTQEAEEDNLYGSLGAKYAKALARSMQHTKEVKGANILNNGFSTSYPIGDGKPLLSATHPLYTGGTFSNVLATPADLSETSLESIMIQIGQTVDDRGIPVLISGTKLVIPVDLQFEAERILSSTQRVGTADNDANAMRNMRMLPGGYTVNHRLTDADAWFVKTDAPDGLKYMNRVGIQRGIEGDFDTGNMRYKSRERYAFGSTDPRGIFGSAGGGS